MSDFVAVCIVFAMLAVIAIVAVYGIWNVLADCIRHCRKIWQRR